MAVDSTLSTTTDLSAAINFSRLKNVLIEGYSRSLWLKSPDEDKIHTKMHEQATHTPALPRALNHEWDQTPTLRRNETRPGKMAYNAASLITWAVTSLDPQTPARSVFSCMWGSSHGSECLQSFKIHFLAVLELRLVVARNVKFLPNTAYFDSPQTWIKRFTKQLCGRVAVIMISSPNQIVFYSYEPLLL